MSSSFRRGADPAQFAWRDLAPAFGLAFVGLGGLVAAQLLLGAENGQFVAVFAPWRAQGDVLSQVAGAGGGVVDFGGLSNIALIASAEADFAARLRDAGAWLVLPAPRLAGCGAGLRE